MFIMRFAVSFDIRMQRIVTLTHWHAIHQQLIKFQRIMMENYWNLSIVLFSAHNQFIDSSDNNCSVEREINWATQRNRNLSKENHSTEELVFDLLFLLSLFVSTQRSHAYDATNNVFVCVYWWYCCLLHAVNLTIHFLPVKKRSWSERNPFLSYANKKLLGPYKNGQMPVVLQRSHDDSCCDSIDRFAYF